MKRKRWICFLSFIGAFFLRFTGFSVWIDQGTSKDTDFTRDVTKAVAYYGDKYFTSIEGAVNSAWNNGTNDIIYVIPGTTCTINESFKIKSGFALFFLVG